MVTVKPTYSQTIRSVAYLGVVLYWRVIDVLRHAAIRGVTRQNLPVPRALLESGQARVGLDGRARKVAVLAAFQSNVDGALSYGTATPYMS